MAYGFSSSLRMDSRAMFSAVSRTDSVEKQWVNRRYYPSIEASFYPPPGTIARRHCAG